MEKKAINIYFVGFASDFNPSDNDFINILKERYEVIITDQNPDYLFYSNFGQDYLDYDCIRIFYTGESITPDFNICDYALAFDRMEFGDRYLRMPLYRLFQYRKNYNALFDREKVLKVDKEKGFCSFVCSNCFADDIRANCFKTLSEYKTVSSGGRYLNNVGGPVPDKLEFQKNYKFAIAFENGSYDGYATEKLVDALAAGSLPIYFGDPNIDKDFNEDAFINGHRFASLDAIIERVKEIDCCDELYLKMLNANPIIVDRRNNDDLREFLYHIFDQDLNDARRRPSSIYAKEFTESLKRYRFFEKYFFKKITRIKKIIYRVMHNAA